MKQQAETLFRAIGAVGDDLIARADEPVKKTPRIWVKWAALAACCVLVIGAAAFVWPMFHAGSSAPDSAAPMTAESAAQEEKSAETAETAEMQDAAEAPEPAAESAAREADTAAPAAVVTLSVDTSTLTRTSASFTLTSETDEAVALHGDYTIETLTDGEWTELPPMAAALQKQPDTGAFGEDACTLQINWSGRYGELPDGTYRLVQPILLPDGSEDTVYAEFTLE